MYHIVKFFLFQLDAEKAHGIVFNLINVLQRYDFFLRWVRRWSIQDPKLGKEVGGLLFRNEVGIAAGLDKNAELLPFWDALGVGFITLGTVTPLPQVGNPKPRLFRLTRDEALINRMGFNNDGSKIVYERLIKFDYQFPHSTLQVGISIGPNKSSVDDSHNAVIDDYITLFKKFAFTSKYFEVNVSSPNTPGLRKLQEDDFLTLLFEKFNYVENLSMSLRLKKTPIFLKVSPDLSHEDFIRLVQFVDRTNNCAGIILSNTTIDRNSLKKSYTLEEIEDFGQGGLSGPMLFSQMNERVAQATEITVKPIIAVGGICSPERANEVLEDGASLIQIYTGLIYEGPRLVKNILKQLKSNVK